MGSFSMAHWLIVALVVLVLFGRGKISETMGDFGKGIRSFRKGVSEGDVLESELPPVEMQVSPALTSQLNSEDAQSARPK